MFLIAKAKTMEFSLDWSVSLNIKSGSPCTVTLFQELRIQMCSGRSQLLEDRREIQRERRKLRIQKQHSQMLLLLPSTHLDVRVDEVFGSAPVDPLSPGDLGLLRYWPIGLGAIAVVPDVDLTVDLAARPVSSFGDVRN